MSDVVSSFLVTCGTNLCPLVHNQNYPRMLRGWEKGCTMLCTQMPGTAINLGEEFRQETLGRFRLVPKH
jgi:hypothetical protein